MNSGTKTLIALVAVVVIAGGAYALLSGGPAPVAAVPQEDPVDAFASDMQAELDMTASAIQAFDSDVDTSVSGVQTAGDSSKLYDPNNL